MEPLTVNVKAELPAIAGLGIKEEIAGKGLSTVYYIAEDVPPPGPGLATVIVAVPPLAVSAAVIATCRVVLETYVVARGLPFH